MKRGLNKILCVSSILSVGLVALLVWRPWVPSEPVYQGKTLGAWLEQWKSTQSSQGIATGSHSEAEAAVRQIGTNGIPILVSMLRSEDHAMHAWLRTKVPVDWHRRLGLENVSERRKENGSIGLMLLGTNAASVAPLLIDLLSKELASTSLAPKHFWTAVNPLSTMGEAADPSIPILLSCFTNKSQYIRRDSVTAVGILGRHPEAVVPALVQYLKTQGKWDVPEACRAIESISMFGTSASAAIPDVVLLLESKDLRLRTAAVICVSSIDPSPVQRSPMNLKRGR